MDTNSNFGAIADHGIRGGIFAFLSMFVMSFGPIINKLAVSSIPPLAAAFVSLVFGSAFCALFSLLSREKILLPRNPWLLAVGLLNGIGVMCLFLAVSRLSPIMVGLLGRFYVVFSTVLGAVWLREKASPVEWGLIGVVVFSSFLLNFKGITAYSLLGVVLVLAQTLFFSASNALIKTRLGDCKPNDILFFNNAISALVVLPFVLLPAQGPSILPTVSLQGIAWIALSSFVANFLGIILFYKAVRHISFTEANVIRALGPVFTVLLSLPIFPQAMSLWNVIGAALMVTSVLLLALVKLPKGKMTSLLRSCARS